MMFKAPYNSPKYFVDGGPVDEPENPATIGLPRPMFRGSFLTRYNASVLADDSVQRDYAPEHSELMRKIEARERDSREAHMGWREATRVAEDLGIPPHDNLVTILKMSNHSKRRLKDALKLPDDEQVDVSVTNIEVSGTSREQWIANGQKRIDATVHRIMSIGELKAILRDAATDKTREHAVRFGEKDMTLYLDDPVMWGLNIKVLPRV